MRLLGWGRRPVRSAACAARQPGPRRRRRARHPSPRPPAAPLRRRSRRPAGARRRRRSARIRCARRAAGVDRRVDLADPAHPHPGDRPRRHAAASSTATTTTTGRIASRPSSTTSSPFGERLGELRRRVDDDLGRSGPRPRAGHRARRRPARARRSSASATRSTRKDNRTYGLTTLRDRHVRFGRGAFTIRYNAKGSKVHAVDCDDPRLCRLVRRCQDLPGQQLFQWIDDDGDRHPVSSGDVNEYLREATGIDATAKTFRTWGASVHGGRRSGRRRPARRRATRNAPSCSTRHLRVVADTLNNTPAVCRRSYVHPKVVDRFLDGSPRRRWEAGPAAERRWPRRRGAPPAPRLARPLTHPGAVQPANGRPLPCR